MVYSGVYIVHKSPRDPNVPANEGAQEVTKSQTNLQYHSSSDLDTEILN